MYFIFSPIIKYYLLILIFNLKLPSIIDPGLISFIITQPVFIITSPADAPDHYASETHHILPPLALPIIHPFGPILQLRSHVRGMRPIHTITHNTQPSPHFAVLPINFETILSTDLTDILLFAAFATFLASPPPTAFLFCQILSPVSAKNNDSFDIRGGAKDEILPVESGPINMDIGDCIRS